jgi:hypothetical protein
MRSRTARHNRLDTTLTTVTAVTALMLSGCTSPPAVIPLLEIVDRQLQAEAQLLGQDAERDAEAVRQMRLNLASGFEADLRQRESLSAEWVRSATDVYVAARDAVTRHELDLERQRRQRADNLRAASEAQRRAMLLLLQQDRLIVDTLGLDAWRLDTPRPPR